MYAVGTRWYTPRTHWRHAACVASALSTRWIRIGTPVVCAGTRAVRSATPSVRADTACTSVRVRAPVRTGCGPACTVRVSARTGRATASTECVARRVTGALAGTPHAPARYQRVPLLPCVSSVEYRRAGYAPICAGIFPGTRWANAGTSGNPLVHTSRNEHMATRTKRPSTQQRIPHTYQYIPSAYQCISSVYQCIPGTYYRALRVHQHALRAYQRVPRTYQCVAGAHQRALSTYLARTERQQRIRIARTNAYQPPPRIPTRNGGSVRAQYIAVPSVRAGTRLVHARYSPCTRSVHVVCGTCWYAHGAHWYVCSAQ